MFGLHAWFTLRDRTLRECTEANTALGAGFHIHAAEDAIDAGAVRRLCEAGILDERSIAAHCVHVRGRREARVGLGSDGYSREYLERMKSQWFWDGNSRRSGRWTPR